MLQLVLHLPPHRHQLVTMQQQLPHIALLHAGNPYPGKAVLQQQLQQQLRIPPVRFLLAHLHGPALARIAQPQLNAQRSQQPLEPQGVAARLHPYQHRPLQLGVKLPRLLRRELAFRVLSRRHIDHGNLLETRMEITTYNLHGGSFRPSLGFMRTQVYSGLVRSRRCYEIKCHMGLRPTHRNEKLTHVFRRSVARDLLFAPPAKSRFLASKTRALIMTATKPYSLSTLFWIQLQRNRINAVAESRRAWAVGEDMSQVPAATRTRHLYSAHAQSVVFVGIDLVFRCRLEKAWPAATGVELRVRQEQFLPTRCTLVHSGGHDALVLAAKRPLGPLLT